MRSTNDQLMLDRSDNDPFNCSA